MINKIYAFEVREDEKKYIAAAAADLGIEITVTGDVLCEENCHLTAGYDAVSTLGRSFSTKALLEKLKANGVRFLTTRTVGYDHIDLGAAKELGIGIGSANYGPESVADFTIMMMLIAMRNYKPALWRVQVNDYSLPGLIGRTMESMTVGIVGTGRIGYRVMENLRGFGCRIVAYDPYPNEKAKEFCEYMSLDELYKVSDMISIHVPLTAESDHMINDESIAKMKDGVILVNCARGPIMDIDAITRGIEESKIGALALDVIETEEGIYHLDRKNDIIKNRAMAYLRQFPNVILTQHMAFYTEQAVESMVRDGIYGIVELDGGKTGIEQR